MAQPPRKAPADLRREALERELLRMQEEPIVEATAGWLSTFAIVTMLLVLIAGVAVLIVLLAG
jgi:hypothetical protein